MQDYCPLGRRKRQPHYQVQLQTWRQRRFFPLGKEELARKLT
jgi:hypothetical protein